MVLERRRPVDAIIRDAVARTVEVQKKNRVAGKGEESPAANQGESKSPPGPNR